MKARAGARSKIGELNWVMVREGKRTVQLDAI